MTDLSITPFNTPIETGVRALAVLVAMFPGRCDLQTLVHYDYLVVHSADANGPPSLHAALPLRCGELLVRRQLIEGGLMLMMSRNLVHRVMTLTGIEYEASEGAASFLALLRSPYLLALIERANWAATNFKNISSVELGAVTERFYHRWTAEFQPVLGQGT